MYFAFHIKVIIVPKYIKTVLVQDHFYSNLLLFTSSNKTTTQSRMIKRTLLSVKGI